MIKVLSSYVVTCFEEGWFELPAVETVSLSDAESYLIMRSMLSERLPCFAAMRSYLLLLLRSGVTWRDYQASSLSMPPTSARSLRLSGL